MNQYRNKTCPICFAADGFHTTVHRILGPCDECISADLNEAGAKLGKQVAEELNDQFLAHIQTNFDMPHKMAYHFNFNFTVDEFGVAFMIWFQRTWCVSIHILFWHISFGRHYVISSEDKETETAEKT